MKNFSLMNKTTLLLLLLIFVFPGITFGKSIDSLTSTDLKKIVRKKEEKVVVLAFWATWCTVCRKHLPELNEISHKYEDKNVSIIGVSLDDNRERLYDFIEKNDITFPVYEAEDKEEMSYIYQIKKIPVLYYYVDGKKHHIEVGYTPPGHVEEDLKNCLSGKKPSYEDEDDEEDDHYHNPLGLLPVGTACLPWSPVE